jgi:hypothetical protein
VNKHTNSSSSPRSLSDSELDAILASPEAFAEHLASLSVAQIEMYLQAITVSDALPEAVQKTMIRLLEQLRDEAAIREREYRSTVGALADGIATALAIQTMIDDLESLEQSASDNRP